MLCPSCFIDKRSGGVCPQCNYDDTLKRSPLVLPHHASLNSGRYRVGRLLGKPGGFGITYLGWDERLQTKVAIKEFLPRDLVGRETDHLTVSAHSQEDEEAFAFGLRRFLDEARTLAQLDHPNIVRVRDFFEGNGTAYLVMDYYDGVTLAEYLSRQPGGKISEDRAIGILMPILDGLREVHAKGFLHRDIKPQNIYLTTGNRPILLDFGAARQAMGEKSHSLSIVLTEGYAPIEQYQKNGKQGPWTDVYAAAATLYNMVTGNVPPQATDRMDMKEDVLARLYLVNAETASAIKIGMSLNASSRPQSISDFQLFLNGRSPNQSKAKTKSTESGKKSSGYVWGIIALIIGVILFNRPATQRPVISNTTSYSQATPDQRQYSIPEPVPFQSPSYLQAPRTQEQERAIQDGERIKRLMENHDGNWDSERYIKASYAFEAAAQADIDRRSEWEDLKEKALKTAAQLAQIVSPYPGAIADAERVQQKMRNQEGQWTAERYRKAIAAFRAAEKVDPVRRAIWQAEQQHALEMAKALERAMGRSSRLSPMAQKYIADGERVYQLMIAKDGSWNAVRYAKAIAAFRAAEGVDPAQRNKWRAAIMYAEEMMRRP